ncbi:fructose-1,6-bisphosphatase [Raineyella antarctica]|uniref:Fructose-1,6-bisphosphatase n=1 Tax=Raineyella antarctica TaxID=1577474 RepID=A0A1G6GXI9_9ACTN|nr:inositol monophosphatase [Raineyella antarctica]SDB86770.1 fructose-1,6-bisphosphatase [Raineyella antarctica]
MAARELSTDRVLEIIQEVADEVIRPRFRALARDEISEKGPGDLVTIADRESELLLTEILGQAYPDAVIIGEEATAANPALPDMLLGAAHGFTIDPVDGTKNFVNGKEDYAVMVGEVRDGRTVRGWIWQPEYGSAYVAERGAGVTHNGVRLSRREPAADPADWTGHSARIVVRQRPADAALGAISISALCCGIDYPRMATGAADFLVYGRPRPWDHVPGILMVEEQGGSAVLTDGSPYVPGMDGFGMVVGATPQVTAAVRTALGDRLGIRPTPAQAE